MYGVSTVAAFEQQETGGLKSFSVSRPHNRLRSQVEMAPLHHPRTQAFCLPAIQDVQPSLLPATV